MDQSSVQFAGDDISASSGNKAAAAATVTLAATANKTNFLAGFDVTGAGATAASVITITVGGLKAGTLTYEITVPAGATTAIQPLQVRFPYPLPASAQNTAITLTVPSFGAGNTNAAACLYGFQRG